MAQNLAAAPIGTTEVISSPLFVQPTVTQPPALVSSCVQAVPEENQGTRWWIIVVIAVVIAIIIGVVVWLAIINRSRDDRKLNESCDDRNKCVSGLVCQSGLCKASIKSSCSTISDCVSSATGCVGGVCIATTEGGLNDPCNNTDQLCGSGLTCTNTVCKSNINQRCTRLSDCVTSATACQNGVCVDIQGGLNQRCPCQSGLICDGSSDFCKRPNGGMCAVDNDCLTGSSCQRGVCTQIMNGGLGDMCRVDMDCRGNLICKDGRCEDYNTHKNSHRRHYDRHYHYDHHNDDRHHRRYDDDHDRRFDYRDDVDDDRAGDDSLFGLGGPTDNLGPPCQSQEGCPKGMFCGGSSIDVGTGSSVGTSTSSMTTISAYSFKDIEINNIVLYKDQNYLLTSSGDVLLDSGSSIISVESNLSLDSLLVFGQSLYAVSSGKLYENICDTSRNLKWKRVTWAPDSLIYSSTTNDNYWLWLQADTSRVTSNNFHDTSINRGYLYQYQGEQYIPRLRETDDLAIGVIRSYGRNNGNYLQISTLQQEALLMPSSRTFTGVSDGAVFDNGNVSLLLSSDTDLYKNVFIINDVDYYISKTRCQKY